MRLQKYISRAGYASRRKAESLIREGNVKVNGLTVREMGVTIDPEKDTVSVKGTVIHIQEQMVYILLNKPEGVVTTLSDNFNRKIVTDFIDTDVRIFPVGRLDYDSKGLVLMTNDGELTNKLTHPKHHIPKKYLVCISKPISPKELALFKNGIDIGGYVTAKCDIIKKSPLCFEITLFEGKNRQIRRMFAYFDRDVVSLQRIAIGKIEMGSLKEGTWRHLKNEEVEYLKNIN
ncbi:MAG: pseudouridine synthase [Clostridiales bacterium]|nr:MAG: pseudouridine synthase [Clostridiales bacterium]